jgi:phosphatidylserine/phosphatidylglycerophosphate/cardiolipin synthase-like enzyme
MHQPAFDAEPCKTSAINIQVELRLFTTLTMHNKYVVIDREVFFVGSQNLTFAGFNYNQENMLLVSDSQSAAEYMVNFEMLWALARVMSPKPNIDANRILQIPPNQYGLNN